MSSSNCCVCFLTYVDNVLPYIIKECGHTCCIDCLRNIHRANRRRVNCPICRTPFNINKIIKASIGYQSTIEENIQNQIIIEQKTTENIILKQKINELNSFIADSMPSCFSNSINRLELNIRRLEQQINFLELNNKLCNEQLKVALSLKEKNYEQFMLVSAENKNLINIIYNLSGEVQLHND